MPVRSGRAPGEMSPSSKTGQAKTESSPLPSKPPSAAAPRSPNHRSSSSTNGLAKAKAQSKSSANIAARAARNLGGFVPNKIFVGGVPIQATEEAFKIYFERFGAISRVELHALRGFGYITYESINSVDDCLEKYEEHYLCKKWVEVKRSIPRELIDSYEREQRRLENELNGVDDTEERKAPSIKVETPSHAQSAPPSWGMPPPAGRPLLPEPAIRAKSAGKGFSKGGADGEEPGGSAMSSQISQLTEMGFSEEVARRVFRECAWDFNKALDRLLSTIGTEDAPTLAEEAEDPPLSASAPTAAASASPKAGGSPPARAKDAPAWGKPAPSAWAKPAAESVWGAPKVAGTAWGKAASPKASTPKATAAKGSPSTPKASLDLALPPAAGSPAPPVPSTPLPPAPGAASNSGGYNSTPVAKAEASAVESSGGAAADQSESRTPPATPPPAKTSSSNQPSAVTLPAAAVQSTGSQRKDAESRSAESASTPLPPNSQPPPSPSEVKSTPAGEAADSIGKTEDTTVGNDSDEARSSVNGIGRTDADANTADAHQSKSGRADSDGAPAGQPPRKRVQRMKREWKAEDPSQLSAADEDFVSVWIDTGTEHGWIHAEHTSTGHVGWLPVCVLQTLAENKRWMKTKQSWQAMGESQCNVHDGVYVVVWIDSRTAQGWTYVEAQEESVGWLPDFCLEWNEV